MNFNKTQKRILKLNILLIVLIPILAQAEPVTLQRAQLVASTFLKNNNATVEDNRLIQRFYGSKTKSYDQQPLLYVFDNPNGGFVIVSGDDTSSPILAYSTTNHFPQNDLPPALAKWMECAENVIRKTRNTSNKTNNDWQILESKTKSSYAQQTIIKLETAQWDQYAPFNDLCPSIDGTICPAGCLPLAFAIIMRYHKYPQNPTNYYIEKYQAYDSGIEFGGWNIDYPYLWDEMPLTNGNDFTEKQKKETATLIRDIGALVKAEYQIKNTGGVINQFWKLSEAFGYDKAAYIANQWEYTEKEWFELLKQNLNKKLPIPMSAWEKLASGHAFVVDGYDSGHKLSINWGWGGNYNGFYTMKAETMGNDAPQYIYSQSAVLDLQPDKNGKWHTTVHMNGSLGGLGVVGNKIENNVPFILANINLDIDTHQKWFAPDNPENPQKTTEFIVTHTDSLRNVKEYISDIFDLQYLYDNATRNKETGSIQSYSYQVKCNIKKDIDYGDLIEIHYRTKNTNNDWQPVRYSIKTKDGCLPLKEKQKLEDVSQIYISTDIRNNTYSVGSVKKTHHFIIYTKPGTNGKLFDNNNKLLSNGGSTIDEYGNQITGAYSVCLGSSENEVYLLPDKLPPGQYTINLRYGLEEMNICIHL